VLGRLCVSKLPGWLESRCLPWYLSGPLCGSALWLGWQSESAPGAALGELPSTATCSQVSHSTGWETSAPGWARSSGATVFSKGLKLIETTVIMR
jgi:hypothetical protein